MEKKNKFKNILTVVTTILLLAIGITFGYYAAQVIFGGKGSAIEATTVKLGDITFNYSGELEFNATNILPGRQILSAIEVNAQNANRLAVYDLVWVGDNQLSTDLTFTVYKSNLSLEEANVNVVCNQTQKYSNGYTLFRDECVINNIGVLGDPINSGYINRNTSDTEVVLAPNETIISDEENVTYYYYVVIEYPNANKFQNADAGKKIDGEIKIQNASAAPDTSILAIYKETDNGYEKTDSIPTNYIFNEDESTCTNDATVSWNPVNKTLTTTGLTAAGTTCELKFDKSPCEKSGTACSTILANKTKEERTAFNSTLTSNTNGKIYSAEEFDGTSYYFAGNTTENYVKFAGLWWRIVRVNYDGSIRLIYQGTSSTSNGIYTTSYFNNFTTSSSAEYVGYMYELGNKHGLSSDSTIKTVLDDFYESKIATHSDVQYVDSNSYYCNDRSITSGVGIGANATVFAGNARINTGKNPTFNCTNNEDIFTTIDSNKGNKALKYPIGTITADEVSYAGGMYNGTNTNYYLYTTVSYWTMTPREYNNNSNGPLMFMVQYETSPGRMQANYVKAPAAASYGVRPVINLRADVKLSGSGTTSSPYTVSF
ncbi:MAG: hypothetical protein E7163_05805 [Firmicutes bacterium]|nr:hypothetical protein [Bacillota bacterium]